MNYVAIKVASAPELDHADQILSNDAASRRAFREAMLQAVDLVAGGAAGHGPYSGATVQGLRSILDELDPCPETGTGIAAALADIGRPALDHALAVGDPAAMAHLHCPVAVPALAHRITVRPELWLHEVTGATVVRAVLGTVAAPPTVVGAAR